MKNKITMAITLAGTLAGMLGLAHFQPARAQLSNMMSNMGGSSMGSSIPGMGGSALPSVSSASPTNLAGVLQYCAQNNYLPAGSDSSASSVKDGLLSKFGGAGNAASDSGYTAGSSGVLDTGNGQTASLGGTGLKAKMTDKVCGMVLTHAKSLL